MSKLVVFDMDGVLADIESSWVFVHRRFGVNNDHSLYAYLRGEIDDLEFIRRDIKLWRDKEPGVTVDRIRSILSDAPIMPGADRTLRDLKSRGIRTAIVSAGIDVLAKMIAHKMPVDVSLANGFSTDAHGALTGEGVLKVRLMDKGDAVEEVMRRFSIDRRDAVSVGNSRYDVSMFKRTGFGIAFRPEDNAVKVAADAVIEEKDLSRILELV